MSLKFNAVILDSNFILLPIQFHLDYLEDIVFKLEGRTKFIIYKQVLDELEAKKERFRKKGKSNKFHTQLEAGKRYLEINKNKFHISFIDEVKNEKETTDQFLLKKAKVLKKESSSVFLATNDYELRKKAIQSEISIIYLRKKQFISITRA